MTADTPAPDGPKLLHLLAGDAAADLAEQPKATRAYLLNVANGACTKLAEKLAGPDLVLPWLLGAIAAPDIGQLFPDTDPRHDAQDSRVFLAEALRRVTAAGYRPTNLDATVICERPKLGPRKEPVREALAALLALPAARVNVKAKTHEKVDAVGEGRAIEVHVVVLIQRDDTPARI
jgi:2-C-methyl-D-erythritol 2,4-cyclodiphosphate synthase